MKRLLMLVALLALAVPATAVAQQPASPSNACKAQRNTIGMTAFRQLYAPTGTPRAAMVACLAQQTVLVSNEAKNAAKECRQERGTTAESRAAFETEYGVNGNGRNAFGKCVSEKVGEAVAEERAATVNAAQACKEERGTTAATRAAFATKYGSRPNAFARCVAQTRAATS